MRNIPGPQHRTTPSAFFRWPGMYRSTVPGSLPHNIAAAAAVVVVVVVVVVVFWMVLLVFVAKSVFSWRVLPSVLLLLPEIT